MYDRYLPSGGMAKAEQKAARKAMQNTFSRRIKVKTDLLNFMHENLAQNSLKYKSEQKLELLSQNSAYNGDKNTGAYYADNNLAKQTAADVDSKNAGKPRTKSAADNSKQGTEQKAVGTVHKAIRKPADESTD